MTTYASISEPDYFYRKFGFTDAFCQVQPHFLCFFLASQLWHRSSGIAATSLHADVNFLGKLFMRKFLHTDARVSHEHNLELSKLRADTVVAALIDRHGIAGDRLFAAGASFLSPIASNDNEEGRALNRRVELVRVQ